MTDLLGAAGRAFLKEFVAALLVLGAGIWAAPNLDQAVLVATVALIGATRAGIKALTVFVPQLTLERWLSGRLGFFSRYAYVGDSLLQSIVAGLIALGIGLADYFLSASPTLDGAKLVITVGLTAIASGLWTILQGALTKGTFPAPAQGFSKGTASSPPITP